MKALTRTHLGLYLGMIFLAGAVSGGVIAFRNAEKASQPPSMEKVCHRMQNNLKLKLGLSDEEFDRIRPILDQTAQELQRIQSRTIQDINAAIRRSHAELAGYLTLEQRQRLQEMDRELCEGPARRAWKRDSFNSFTGPSRP